MTDTVDILFKELPRPASTEPIRKNDRLDTERSDRSVDVSQTGREKSFAEHLDESNDANEPRPLNKDEPSTQSGRQNNEKDNTETDTIKDKPVSLSDDRTQDDTATEEVTSGPSESSSTNAVTAMNNEGNVSLDTAQVQMNDEVVKKVPTSTANITPANVQSESAVSANVNNSQTQGNTETKNNVEALQNTNNVVHDGNAKTATKPEHVAQQNVVVNNIKAPEQPVVPEKVQAPQTDASNKPQEQIAATTVNSNAPTDPVSTVNTVNQNNANANIAEQSESVTEEKGTRYPEVAAAKTLNPTNTNSGVPEKTQGVNTDAANVDDGIQISTVFKPAQNELLEKSQPTETVAVESTRTAIVAPNQVPTQNSVNKNNSNVGKSSAKPSANKANGAQTAAASQGQQATNNTHQNTLLNAQRSDISIDVGTTAQKLEPAPLQPLNVNAQTSLPNGALLAAQDVNIQRLNATNPLLSVSRPETPVTARMINEQITVAINRNIVNGQNNFSIRLHPAELGQVDIRLEFAADGKMNASMIVENERTLSMLQRDQAALEKALQDAGVNLSGKNMNFSLAKQSQENGKQEFSGNNQTHSEDIHGEELSTAVAMQQARLGYSNQAVDISV